MSLWQQSYQALTQFGQPLVHMLLARREAMGKEDPDRLPERFGYADRERPAGKLVWVHAASVGEAMSTLLLLEKLAARYPDAHFMITSGTVTSARILASRLPPRCFHQFVPVDLPVAVARFLDHWRPDLALWIESEFWPNLLAGLRRRKIPAALLNARISARSQRNWRWAGGWLRVMLGTFRLCLTQTEAAQDTFRALGAPQVAYCGNLKFAALPLPDDSFAQAQILRAVDGRPCWLFASSHPGEEDIAVAAHRLIAADFPTLLTVIVPRHPARGGKLMRLFTAQGLSAAQRSLGLVPNKANAVYLADTLGELGLFYRLCPIVCIAGSFVPVGGHNPIEPALLGCAIACGPQMPNFAEVVAGMLAAKAACEVADAAALAAFVKAMLDNPAARRRQGERARLYAETQAQTHDRVIAALAPLLAEARLT